MKIQLLKDNTILRIDDNLITVSGITAMTYEDGKLEIYLTGRSLDQLDILMTKEQFERIIKLLEDNNVRT